MMVNEHSSWGMAHLLIQKANPGQGLDDAEDYTRFFRWRGRKQQEETRVRVKDCRLELAGKEIC